MSEPLISIVMPLRNAATTLAETLDSIQSQTLQNIEVIMIDDFSEDDTRLIAEALCNSDRRFRCIKATNRGLVPALNQGIREAQSPLIARMDGDDIMLPSRLEKQWELLEQQPSVGVVSCGVRSFSDGEIGEGYRLYDSWLNSLVSHEAIYKARYIESPLAHPTAVVRRSILESMGGYRDMGWPEDYDLWLRLLESGVRFQKVPEVLLHWRDQPQRTSRVDPAYRPESFLDCKVAHLVKGPLRDVSSVSVWGAGHWGGRLGKRLMGAGYKVAFFVDINPRKIGGTRHGAPIVAAEDLQPDPSVPLLVAVGRRGARALIEESLAAWRFENGRDYLLLA